MLHVSLHPTADYFPITAPPSPLPHSQVLDFRCCLKLPIKRAHSKTCLCAWLFADNFEAPRFPTAPKVLKSLSGPAFNYRSTPVPHRFVCILLAVAFCHTLYSSGVERSMMCQMMSLEPSHFTGTNDKSMHLRHKYVLMTRHEMR